MVFPMYKGMLPTLRSELWKPNLRLTGYHPPVRVRGFATLRRASYNSWGLDTLLWGKGMFVAQRTHQGKPSTSPTPANPSPSLKPAQQIGPVLSCPALGWVRLRTYCKT